MRLAVGLCQSVSLHGRYRGIGAPLKKVLVRRKDRDVEHRLTLYVSGIGQGLLAVDGCIGRIEWEM